MNIQKIFQLVFAFPFTVLYGIGVMIINYLYKWNIIKSVRFDLPIITVGNLSVGGTGKTPHVEYLIQLLRPYMNVATLSRGYKRKTKGYIAVAPASNAALVGDEPLQFKRKFRDVFVAVAESRTMAVSQIMMDAPGTQVILLDDGYQHRALETSHKILLTAFDDPFFEDFLLPGGTLREWKAGKERADIIIVTKCPVDLSEADKTAFIRKMKPFPHQKVFFSYYKYGLPYAFLNPEIGVNLDETLDAILISGLASSDYLVKHLDKTVNFARILDFPDHHFFKEADLINLKKQYDELKATQKVILTTEKDAVRLELHRDYIIENQLPIFVLPIQVDFLFGEKTIFDETMKEFLLNFKT
jgi:tetraacyldisaccharide 4'-kinase